jgi:CDP-glycerol glycerophosphotransferase
MTATITLDTTEAVPALVVSGPGEAPDYVRLVGARAGVEADPVADGSGWSARLPLHRSRWGGAELPLPGGEYRLEVAGHEAAGSVPMTIEGTLRVAVDGGSVEIGPPLDPSVEDPEGRAALERRYTLHSAPLENAVFFESFYGRVAGDNPLAIDREIARIAPGVTRYWSVIDLAVEVPEGAIAVVEGSSDWWRARSASRLLIVNDWLRRRYARRPGQKVLQTWHGTPLKRLALTRPGFRPRAWGAALKESRRWNVLLAQNPYAARILARAYAFRGREMWVEGYPRNDVLSTGDGGSTRRQLGIGDDEKVLLYAPTWRDDRSEMVDFMDPQELAERAGAVVLVRGHSRTLLPGQSATGARVIDVTGYADVARLMCAADAMITDYSSVMFDFTITGKPIYFLVPDLEHYRSDLRGFYFDLAERAPGPVVRTTDDLIEALGEDPARYADRYAEWRTVFNARDDGRAAERVTARIFDRGLLTR